MVAGCDAGAFVHGNNAHELTCLVERGMKPMDAIQAATGRASQCLGLENLDWIRRGWIEGGPYSCGG